MRLSEFASRAADQARKLGRGFRSFLEPAVKQFRSVFETARRARPKPQRPTPKLPSPAEMQLLRLADQARNVPPVQAEAHIQQIEALIDRVVAEGRMTEDQADALQQVKEMLALRKQAKPLRAEEQQKAVEEALTDIKVLGRGYMGYDPAAAARLMQQVVRTPGSSNVYSFVYQPEEGEQARFKGFGLQKEAGILYVTFKLWAPGMSSKSRPDVPGPTYAYYNVPHQKYTLFVSQIATSGKGAGEAIWDYLRHRGSRYGHQHPYRLVSGALVPHGGTMIQAGGTYVPRKATAWGYRKRHLPAWGVGKRGSARSQLPERPWSATPNRGTPNTGAP